MLETLLEPTGTPYLTRHIKILVGQVNTNSSGGILHVLEDHGFWVPRSRQHTQGKERFSEARGQKT